MIIETQSAAKFNAGDKQARIGQMRQQECTQPKEEILLAFVGKKSITQRTKPQRDGQQHWPAKPDNSARIASQLRLF